MPLGCSREAWQAGQPRPLSASISRQGGPPSWAVEGNLHTQAKRHFLQVPPSPCAGPQGSQMLWPWTDTPHPKLGDPSLFSGPHWGSCILRSRAGGPRSWKTSGRWVSAGWGPGPSGLERLLQALERGGWASPCLGVPPCSCPPCPAPGPHSPLQTSRAVSAAAVAAQATVRLVPWEAGSWPRAARGSRAGQV